MLLMERIEKETARFIEQSRSVVVVELAADGTIRTTNALFAELVGSTAPLSGHPLGDFVRSHLPDDLLETLAEGEVRQFSLNLQGAGTDTFGMKVKLFATDGGFVMFGEVATIETGDMLAEMGRLNTELLNVTRELERKNAALERARIRIKTLSGLLPICAHCKKIRDDGGYWQQVESYVRDHSEATFSHSICPDCMTEHYGDILEGQ